MSIIVKIFGWSVILSIFLLLFSFMSFAFGIYANTHGIIVNYWPFNDIQKIIYRNTRNIWQYQIECIEFDEDLIYKPALGKCVFNNLEFQTNLNFDQFGRNVPARNNKSLDQGGIAVIGDSHAMGWGVDDSETFSNILQEKIDIPVYNFGVSSYATERELLRLFKSEIYSKISIIVIQYSSNDLNENKGVPINVTNQYEKFRNRILIKKDDPRKRNINDHIYQNLSIKVLYRIFSLPFSKIYNIIFGDDKKIDSENHRLEINRVIQYYDRYLDGKKIIIFYSNAHGRRFNNFSRIDENLNDIKFIDLNLRKTDHYYEIDDHLNANGHKYIGESLADLIAEGL